MDWVLPIFKYGMSYDFLNSTVTVLQYILALFREIYMYITVGRKTGIEIHDSDLTYRFL